MRLIDSCITQLKAQGSSRTCNESKEEEEASQPDAENPFIFVLVVKVENNNFTEMCCGTEAGSYLRLIDSCITQLKAQGPSRTCNESKEEEEASQPDADNRFIFVLVVIVVSLT